jgi:hypothetical protein
MVGKCRFDELFFSGEPRIGSLLVHIHRSAEDEQAVEFVGRRKIEILPQPRPREEIAPVVNSGRKLARRLELGHAASNANASSPVQESSLFLTPLRRIASVIYGLLWI